MAAYNSSAYNRTKRRARSSLAGALESERLEWVEDERLESGPSSNRRPPAQAAPVRSQLDTAPSPDILPPRHGSIAGIGVGVTSPSNNRRSWAGPVSESASPSGSVAPGTATSYASLKRFPGESSEPSAARRASDNSDIISIGKKKIVDRNKLDNNEMPVLPKRTIQIQLPEKPPREPNHHHKPSQSKSTMAAMMSGFDLKVSLPSFARGRTPSRQSSSRGASLDSRVPQRRARSGSQNRWLGSNPLNLSSSKPGKPAMVKEKPSPMNNTHPNHSDPVLPESVGNGTSVTSPPKESESPEPDINTATSSTGDERLAKDLYDSENNPMDSSEDEPDESSSSDEDSDSEIERGRKKAPNASDQASSLGQVDGPADERM